MARTVWVGPDRSWPTLGWQVLDWIETYLCHGPGDVEGDPLVLDDEFAQFVLDCYRVFPRGHPREGRRVVSTAELSRPKGRAKSELAGALVCAEFVGPVRFAGWDGADPIGRPVRYPFIRCLATEEQQSGNTYDNAKVMLGYARERWPDRFGHLDIGDTRIYLGSSTGGEIRPSTASGASKDGGKETFAVADEPHLYRAPELHRMFSTVRRNTQKRRGAEGWMLLTGTSFQPGEGSVAEITAAAAEEVLAGKRSAAGMLYDHREAEGPVDWRSDEEMIAALRDVYGPFAEVMDLERIVAEEIRHPTATEADSRRYWLNQRWKGSSRAVDPTVWDALADPRRNPSPGAPIVLAFDGSDRGERADDTVLVGWTVEDRPHLFLIDRWRRPEGVGRDWSVPRSQVRARVAEMRETMMVRRFVADPPYWREQLEEWGDEFGVDEHGTPVVVEFTTNRSSEMGPAIDLFLELLDHRGFTHDGSPELREYALNAALGTDRAGRPALRKPTSAEKIDGLVAAVIGLPSALELVSAPESVDLLANVH